MHPLIPDFAAAGFIVASAIIHVAYFVLVGRLYRNADLSVAYPIMRGLAPLIACLIAALTLAEVPKPLTLAGVLILVAGVVTMGLSGLAQGRIDRATLVVALANSAIIAVYTVVDGEGGASWPDLMRRTPTCLEPSADALTAALYLPLLFGFRGVRFAHELMRDTPRSAIGGAAAFGGYALVVWAMTQTTIGAVAALRESSVVFAALIGVVFLGRTIPGRAGWGGGAHHGGGRGAAAGGVAQLPARRQSIGQAYWEHLAVGGSASLTRPGSRGAPP